MKQKKLFLSLLSIVITLATINYIFVAKGSFKTWNMPLNGKIILLDAGHGAPDGGAIGDENIVEKDITLKIVKKLQSYLEEQGALVEFTRATDVDLAPKDMKGYSKRKSFDLRARLGKLETSNADIFLSIHLNAIPFAYVKGGQVFYYPSKEENYQLAKSIQNEFAKNLPNGNKEVKKMSKMYLLKKSNKVSALVEAGFLSNEEEKFMLASEQYQDKIAETIYRGIMVYFTNPPKVKDGLHE